MVRRRKGELAHSEPSKKEDGMSRKRFKPEQIINLLREAEVELSQGRRISEVCRSLEISEQSYYRWRSEYGGMKLEQSSA